jgi:hypothetical protein
VAKTKWDTGKLIDALQREAGRIFDSGDFLSETERDTFVRLLEMTAWLMHDRCEGKVPSFSDAELQPLRDWMRNAGAKRSEYVQFGYVFPSFNHRTAEELSGKVVGIRPGLDPE